MDQRNCANWKNSASGLRACVHGGLPVHVDVRAMMVEVSGELRRRARSSGKPAVPHIISPICEQPCRDVCKPGRPAGGARRGRAGARVPDVWRTGPRTDLERFARRVAIVGAG